MVLPFVSIHLYDLGTPVPAVVAVNTELPPLQTLPEPDIVMVGSGRNSMSVDSTVSQPVMES